MSSNAVPVSPSASESRNSLDWLLQRNTVEQFIGRIGKTQRQVVYDFTSQGRDSCSVYSALVPLDHAEQALEQCGWELHAGDGLPGFSVHHEDGEELTTYLRFGTTSGIRPFVIHRSFEGAWPKHPEVCEEFRHIHNLAHDHERGRLLSFDESGYEVNVADIRPGFVEVDLGFLKRSLAATENVCAIYFDIIRRSDLDISVVPKGERNRLIKLENGCYCLDVAEDVEDKTKTFSRICGKVLIQPGPVDTCGFWPFDVEQASAEVSFIIGVDEHGGPATSTSDREKLDNYFGKNPGAPHYLTPVFFRLDVLTKYYADPERYTVSDGSLQCLGLWSMRIDNDNAEYVTAFLGDLGRDLPHAERLHWRSHNIPPAGGISATNWKRSFLAQFTDPQAADLRFRQEYSDLIRQWVEKHGWSLYRKLDPADEHLLDTVRIPITKAQSEVDEQVLTLAKLLVDRLNEAEIVNRVGPGPKGEKGLGKLERFLSSSGFPAIEALMSLLHDLQGLRSSGSAHLKGERYQRLLKDLSVAPGRTQDVLPRLLESILGLIATLREHYLSPGEDTASASEVATRP
jgi:hypothetical protein